MSARQRSGRGEPLVLLHGVGLDHTLWDDLAPLLAPDFEVLRYDLLGLSLIHICHVCRC